MANQSTLQRIAQDVVDQIKAEAKTVTHNDLSFDEAARFIVVEYKRLRRRVAATERKEAEQVPA